MKKIILKINGMHCMSCSLGLEEKLEELSFVNEANVDFKTSIASITVDEEKYNFDKIKKVVYDMNFKIEE